MNHYEERFYALISSHMDESVDPGGTGIFAVGGILGRGVPLFQLDRRWDKLLEEYGIEYFKASECNRASKQFRKFVSDPEHITPSEREKLDSISHEFLKLIVHPIIHDRRWLVAQGVGVVKEDFYEVISGSEKARAVLGPSPYYLAYHLAMIQCAWIMRQVVDSIKEDSRKNFSTKSYMDCVCFLCDEDEEHSAEASSAYLHLKNKNPKAANYMATFAMASDKECQSLQAADAAVYEVRRALNLSLGQTQGTLRSQFLALADEHIMGIITCSKKDHLLHIVDTHEPGEPFHLDAFMDTQFNENIKIVL